MKKVINQQFYPEDMIPYSVVRSHLRYSYGDAEELVQSYVASAADYLSKLSDHVFSSNTPDQHETAEDTYDTGVAALQSTVTIYLDRDEREDVHYLRNITGSFTATVEYMDTNGDYVALVDTNAKVRMNAYPIKVDFTKLDEPSGMITDEDEDVYKITLTGGSNVKDLPRQFRQALLLLVGHYDMHRETEYLGGVTSELKEGVSRLISTVKAY